MQSHHYFLKTNTAALVTLEIHLNSMKDAQMKPGHYPKQLKIYLL